MICMTARDSTAQQTAERLDRFPDALHEVRLDLCTDRAACLRVVARRSGRTRILTTCRPSRQQGGFSGDEQRRVNLLKQALAAGVWAVDLEWDSAPHHRKGLWDLAGPTRMVLSHHLWRRPEPGELRRLANDMTRLPVATIKLAAMAEDVTDLAEFLDLDVSDRRLVLVPMGQAGRIGRVRYRQLGSSWTYVASSPKHATAPGQLDADQADVLRIEEPTDLFVLLGGNQVQGSPGPTVYNEWFKSNGIAAQYLSAPTAHPPAAISVLERLGLKGASVTMPHKVAALEIATERDRVASHVGGANTLKRTQQGWHASNTDVIGVTEAILRASGAAAGKTAVVLGSGGAAAAAVSALVDMGSTVTVLGRNEARTAALAQRFSVSNGPIAALEDSRFHILVQATPMGSDGHTNPVSNPGNLEGTVVLDMILAPTLTPLLRAAKHAGARAIIPGLEMWIWQGIAQMQQWMGRAPDPVWMRNRAAQALAATERRKE
ncbi:MAG: type I 3-dehydroquinate dehydratase [Deltaproteobacteria bacterium]|nr:type I 3-dehydroquinate dehydratase [Deltaproteobacteria bacterium]